MKTIFNFWQRIRPPEYSNEEKNRKARTLFLVSRACFIGLITILGVRIVGLGSDSQLIIPLFISLLLLSFSHLLLLKEKLEAASYILIGTLFGLCSYIVVISDDGYHDTALFAIPGLLIIAGILLEKWQFYILTGITLLLIAVLVALEHSGIRVTRYNALVSPYDGVDIVLVIAITAVCVNILTSNLVKSLKRARQNEKALQESEAKYRNLVQYAPTGIYEFDMEKLTFIGVNDVMCEYTGYTEKEFLKLNPFDILSDDSQTILADLVTNVFENHPEELAAEYKLKGKNNKEFWVLANAKFFYENGMPKRAMAVVHDLTEIRRSEQEKKKLEQQLRQAHKLEAIGTLAGGIAHDFNNILSGILGYSQLAQKNNHTPGKTIDNINQVLKGTKRATELVQQILTFSRQTEYRKKPFQMYIEINEALKLLRSSIPTTIEIVKHLNSTSMVFADPAKIHQLIMNLSTNAYQAMKNRGGSLTIKLTDVKITKPEPLKDKQIAPGDYLELQVIDTGCGMDEAGIAKAFDPYYTTKGIGEGTGFGLAIVQAVVDEHNGYIKVLSNPGKGTRFYIYLPVFNGEAKPGKPEIEVHPTLKGSENIMFVDDEAAIRGIAKDFMESHGYRIALFENGFAARTEFKKRPTHYDLVVTDMNMPGLAGDQLFLELRKIRPEIPIIMCTGFSDSMSEEKAAAMGINAFFLKPVEMNYLCRQMRQVLDKQKGVTRDQ